MGNANHRKARGDCGVFSPQASRQLVDVDRFGHPVEAMREHTVATVARQWRLPARQLRKVLAARGPVSPAGDPGLDQVKTFTTEAARGVLDRLAASISRPEAMRQLGLTQNQLRVIEDAGLLPALRLGPDVKPRHDGRAVAALLSGLDARIVGAVDPDASDWQSLTKTARRAKLTLSDMLTKALAGDIELRRVMGVSGLAGLRFHIPDALAPAPADPRLGRRAVAERLHFGEAVIDWLVAAGHLRCEAGFIPSTRLRKFSFDPAEIDASSMPMSAPQRSPVSGTSQTPSSIATLPRIALSP